MKIAFYIGNHDKDSVLVRLGWALTRLGQKGPYADVTHVEAIHQEYSNGEVLIASSSARDGGVRDKRALLTPGNWRIVDVTNWSVELSQALLAQTRGTAYDWRGAAATMLPGSQNPSKWFCNEWVASPYLKASGTFTPSQLMALALSLGDEVTGDFFASRQVSGSAWKTSADLH